MCKTQTQTLYSIHRAIYTHNHNIHSISSSLRMLIESNTSNMQSPRIIMRILSSKSKMWVERHNTPFFKVHTFVSRNHTALLGAKRNTKYVYTRHTFYCNYQSLIQVYYFIFILFISYMHIVHIEKGYQNVIIYTYILENA